MADLFWNDVDDYLARVRTCNTVAEIIDLTGDLFAAEAPYAAGDAFFPGSGGDDQLYWALNDSWTRRAIDGDTFFVATDYRGQSFTYIDGDLYHGDRSPRLAG